MGYHLTSPGCEAGCTSKTAYPRSARCEAGFRFLHPEIGRWISRDPIGVSGGANANSLTGNDTIGRRDPLGLQEVVNDPNTDGETPFDIPFSLGDKTGKLACGDGRVVGKNNGTSIDISFSWVKGKDWAEPGCCLCSMDLGWIQHVKDTQGWRFDNPNYDRRGSAFQPSDPEASVQPNIPPVQWKMPGYPKSPYYGGGLPLQTIDDSPDSHEGDSFVTQLVCPPSGEVLWELKWEFNALTKDFNTGKLNPRVLILKLGNPKDGQ